MFLISARNASISLSDAANAKVLNSKVINAAEAANFVFDITILPNTLNATHL